jgi:gliding motility-associated-like protein
MKRHSLFSLFIILLISTFSFGQADKFNSENFAKDQSFIENKGQYDNRNWDKQSPVLYAYSQNPFYVFFSKNGVTYRIDKTFKDSEWKRGDDPHKKRSIQSELIDVKWIDANDNVEVIAEDQVQHFYSYAQKNQDESVSNLNNVKGFKKITYKNIYDFTDIEYLIHPNGGIKYNIILRPGADPSKIQLEYNHKQGGKKREETQLFINTSGQLEINSSLGQIIEHAPVTHYAFNTNEQINTSYVFETNRLSFVLDNYDNSKTIVIDPWIISPNFTTSSAVWEVETDAAGNIYAIGGETPMELKKYNTAGVLQWTYTTPWDTSNVWLGTLATDALGNSYVTSGVTANMHKVSTAGALVWTTTLSGGLQYNSEWWSITFNCDQTKLIVGGTWVDGILSFDFYAGIFEINTATGAVLNDQVLDYTNIGGFGSTPVEVRSIASSKNAKYVFLTHQEVGAINQNLGACPTEESIYQVPNQDVLGYKCENYLPATQNGGGLKAIIANQDYFYTHAGNEIRRWDLTTGALLNTVALPGGGVTNIFGGGIAVHCSGLAVDDCGNIYAGSKDRVVKFDENLNILQSETTTFNVYDVSVNSNGEIIACGAQQNNQSTNRNGRIESINMAACSQFTLVCCDANICPVEPLCSTDSQVTLQPSSPGGTWSISPATTGFNVSTGVLDPSIAAPGTYTITYTLACGSESIVVSVAECSVLSVCEETNGDLTVSGGQAAYTWQNWQETTVSSNDCATCGGVLFLGICTVPLPCSITTNGWVTFGTGTTVTPPVGATSIQIIDGTGASIIVDPNTVIACGTTPPCPTITVAMSNVNNVACFGLTNGTATATASGGAGPYTYTWTPGNLTGPTQTTLGPGNYTINVVDNNACPGSGTVTITQPATALTATATSTATGCGASTGSATASPNGGTPGYTYSWAPSGGSGITASNLSAGTYTVTVTDLNGCTTTATTTVSTTNGPSIVVSNSSPVSCFGDTDGSATVSGSGGTGTLTYNWMPGNLSGATQNALDAGTYTVTVTDGSGCTNSTTVTITEPLAISITQGTVNPADCGQSNGSASVNVSGGAGGFTYTWSPTGGNATTANNIPSGSYTFEAEDQNGCVATLNVVVTNIGGPTVTVQSSDDVSCFGLSDGSAAVTASGGTTPYTYSWSPSGGSGAAATGLAAGTYTVTVTDNTSCVGSTTVTIGEPNAIVVTETIVDANCGATDGSISLAAIGGSSPYTFAWTPNGETSNSISGIAAGSYSVTVTDDNGCTTTENYTVLNIGSIPITVSPVSTTINQGESVQLQASGATTYSWSPTTGLSCSDCPNPIATPNLTTTYTVTGTDAFGCTGTAQTTISIVTLCGDLFVPTVFTPNDQGPAANNILCIHGNCIAELKYSVFNRWGEVVFTTEDPSECWDGNYRDKPVQTGVYAYKIYAVLFDGTEINESGNLTILK